MIQIYWRAENLGEQHTLRIQHIWRHKWCQFELESASNMDIDSLLISP